MNMNLKMVFILCLCIILCDTSKASEKSNSVECFAVIIICCLGAMKIKDSVEQIILDVFHLMYLRKLV